MKNKIFLLCFTTICFLAVLVILFIKWETPGTDTNRVDYTLYVDGRKVQTDTDVYIRYEDGSFVEIPIVAVMEAMGGKVEWTSNTTANIALNGKRFVLDTENYTFCEEGDQWSCICPPPGTTRGLLCRAEDGELVVDSDSLTWFFRAIGAEFSIAATEQKVYITSID